MRGYTMLFTYKFVIKNTVVCRNFVLTSVLEIKFNNI